MFAWIKQLLRRLIGASFLTALFDGYRPERHYMRGAGPKSRAVHPDTDACSRSA